MFNYVFVNINFIAIFRFKLGNRITWRPKINKIYETFNINAFLLFFLISLFPIY